MSPRGYEAADARGGCHATLRLRAAAPAQMVRRVSAGKCDAAGTLDYHAAVRYCVAAAAMFDASPSIAHQPWRLIADEVRGVRFLLLTRMSRALSRRA